MGTNDKQRGGYFKVLRGRHADANGAYTIGDVVKSEIDLVGRFGAEKFERVDKPVERSKPVAQPESDSTSDPKPEHPTREELSEMTVPELRQWAEDEEIDVTGLNRKEELITAITLHYEG